MSLGLIVVQGKIIKVDSGQHHFERSSEHPYVVKCTYRPKVGPEMILDLPARPSDAESFIEAYRRTCKEHMEYSEPSYE